ncbi:hypothetical protein [Umezawaea sp. Da 62-37]|uniref:hypothetical protein n=1 Tax=Umezawaea sp. Da 62-37 TaxID=3075927 RepID=UPI0028F6DB59|nr:hypothetical protein [Umezawaea sp. Da 62-37]WNV83139.1 hypothetical protein RM788_33800 [Umezawaea sp. Da 62-37]
MLTLEVTRISVAGAEYEIGIIGGRFREPSRTVVLSGWTTVVEQESADPEQAITALLEVLNEQAR